MTNLEKMFGKLDLTDTRNVAEFIRKNCISCSHCIHKQDPFVIGCVNVFDCIDGIMKWLECEAKTVNDNEWKD